MSTGSVKEKRGLRNIAGTDINPATEDTLSTISTNIVSSIDGKYITLVDKESTTNMIYLGKALHGSASSAAVWQVARVDKTSSPIKILYAGTGPSDFTNIFDNAPSLTYNNGV